jgi:hypothetical protein
MPRLMSFSMTTAQFLEGSKTVTRRLKWDALKSGDILQGVEKAMGLNKGEKVKRLGLLRVVSVRKEPLAAITKTDCILEGFPDLTPKQFIQMLCEHYGISSDTLVNRIEFEHITEDGSLRFPLLSAKTKTFCHRLLPTICISCSHLVRPSPEGGSGFSTCSSGVDISAVRNRCVYRLKIHVPLKVGRRTAPRSQLNLFSVL